MKKVPSSSKIITKGMPTIIQSLNVNSPKSTTMNKCFRQQVKKDDTKKVKSQKNIFKNDSAVNVLKVDNKKTSQMNRKSSKKVVKENKDIVNQKSIKGSKSQRQLAILSQKLKKLEQKIKIMKEKEKNQSGSHRSHSKNRQNGSFAKKETTSSRKQLSIVKKYTIPKTESHKTLKKSYSDKMQFEVLNQYKINNKKKVQVLKFSKSQSQQKKNEKKSIKEKHDSQVIHQFVTQVPNNHSYLKQSIEKSLPYHYYALTPSNQSEDQQQEDQYYVGKAIKSLVRPALFPIRQHLIQSLQTLQFLQNIKKPTNKQIEKKQMNLSHSKFRETIVLDLDQTLIHCNQTLHNPYDVKLSIKFPTGQRIDAGVNIRPFAKQFLHQLSKICEVIVFTASHECYATVVLDHLDPKRQMISHRLFREHCWQTQDGIYIKDLRVLKDRDLDNMILVDNAAYSYFFQLENGVPIIPFYDDKEDKELQMLLQYIKQTIQSAQKKKQCIRRLNASYFRLIQYSKFDDIGPLVEQLYNTDSSSFDS